MAGGPTLTVTIDAETKGLEQGITQAEQKVSRFGASGNKLLGFAAKAAKVVTPIAAITGVAVKLAKAAGDAAQASAEFDTALKNAGISAGAADPAMKAAVQNAKDMAFSGGDAKKALADLALATGDADEAARLLAVAEDIARASGADLETAANAVAKATNGQDRALIALMPGLHKGATAQDTLAAATAASAGQADNFAKSTDAMGIKAKAAFKGMAITIGSALLPILQGLAAILGPIIGAFIKLVNIVIPPLIPLFAAVGKVLARVGQAIGKVTDFVVKLTEKIVALIQNALNKVQDPLNKVRDLLDRVRDAVGRLTDKFGGLGSAIGRIMDKISGLIDKLRSLMDPLNNALSKLRDLNPFGNTIDSVLGRTYSASAQGTSISPYAVTPAAQTGGMRASGVTINIYGDPSVIEARVTGALRAYARRNGVQAVFQPDRH